MNKYEQRFAEYQAYLKQQIAARFPDYLSEHIENVAKFALETIRKRNGLMSDEYAVWTIAILHDILEDTPLSIDELRQILEDADEKYSIAAFYVDEIIDCIETLTHDKKQLYNQYIMNIVEDYQQYNDSCTAIYAFIVKKADMRDHFTQIETLTPQLIEKYKPFIQYFLKE